MNDITTNAPIMSPGIASFDMPACSVSVFEDRRQSGDNIEMNLDINTRGLGQLHSTKQLSLANVRTSTSPNFKGVFFKTRFHGQSSWLNYLNPVSQASLPGSQPRRSLLIRLQHSQALKSISITPEHDFTSGEPTFEQCKAIGHDIKIHESRTVPFFGSAKDLVPNRALSDQLVQAYLRTLQTVFGIIYVPSFREEYKAFWADPTSVDESFVILLLLVMCNGSTFCEASISRATVLQWIQFVSTWLSLLEEKARLELGTLRIQCLLLLARQVKSVQGNLAWRSAGSLMRSAMQMGMHIDPTSCPQELSHAEVESRRRLWAAILELDLQASMDCGTVPTIDYSSFNCAPPSNIDDASLQSSASSTAHPASKPLDEPTQSSVQVLLMKTMPVRIKIVRHLNSIHSDVPYQNTLDLDSELLLVIRECSAYLDSYRMSSMPPASFQTKLFHLMVDRFLLGLHHPFAITQDPLHYYSRKSCVDTSFFLLSFWASPTDDDFCRLRLSGTGMFRNVYMQIALFLCGELISQANTDQLYARRASSVRRETRDAIESCLELAEARLGEHERNINFHVIISCILARAKSMQAGNSIEQKVDNALRKSLKICSNALKTRWHDLMSSEDTWSDLPDLELVEFQ